MTHNSTKFYNMLVHLIQNNHIYEENVAVKNIWEKEGNIFLDLYFYSRRKSYIFDSVFIRDIYDVITETTYCDIKDFLAIFNSTEQETPNSEISTNHIMDNKIVGFLKQELIILSFMANCCGYYSTLKENIIIDYIIKHSSQAQNLSRNYLETYLKTITPNYKDFSQAIQELDYHNINNIEHLCHEVLKVCISDSRLHYTEKIYLAELLQIIRDAGIKLDLEL